ncbi:MAG: hypothetical protein Q4G39_10070 [Brachymonas sp.]|nr:hypothetical protein [Brachymonas sp.]
MALNLTNDQQQLLASLPHMVGSAVVFAGNSGLFGTGKEVFTNGKALIEGAQQYPNNELIQSIVPNPQGDRSEEMAEMKATREWMKTRSKDKGVDSPEKLSAQAIADVKEANALLNTLDATQAKEYRDWVMQAAEKVAMAATEGGFLGFGGERLSEGEKKILAELKSAFGMA